MTLYILNHDTQIKILNICKLFLISKAVSRINNISESEDFESPMPNDYKGKKM